MDDRTPRRLKMMGMFLFLLGLITGFLLMALENPRMGLAAHLEGVMNGTFLVVSGLVWHDLKLSLAWKKAAYWILLYGTFANWLFSLLGAIFGTSRMTPIAGAGYTGSVLQENLISVGLVTVGLTMVFSLAIIVFGLRGKKV